MAKVTYKVNAEESVAQLERRRERIRVAVRGIVEEEAMAMVNDARKSMKGSKSGRTYTKGGITWRASASGESPASVTGAYAASISAKIKQGGMMAEVGPNIFYAKFHKNRPLMGPVLEKRAPGFIQKIRAALRSA